MSRTVEIDEEILHRLYINCGLFYESVKNGKVPTQAEVVSLYNTLVELHQALPARIKGDGVVSVKTLDFWKAML